MAQNTAPIFAKTPIITWYKIAGVDGATDGTDADVGLAFTGNATNGSFLYKLVVTPRSTSGSTTTSAAAVRVYLNNGSTVGTGTNNVLYKELTIPATAVNVAGTTMVPSFEIPMNIQIPASYRVYVGATALAANTNLDVAAIGGDY
jgi:hypothetical protein